MRPPSVTPPLLLGFPSTPLHPPLRAAPLQTYRALQASQSQLRPPATLAAMESTLAPSLCANLVVLVAVASMRRLPFAQARGWVAWGGADRGGAVAAPTAPQFRMLPALAACAFGSGISLLTAASTGTLSTTTLALSLGPLVVMVVPAKVAPRASEHCNTAVAALARIAYLAQPAFGCMSFMRDSGFLQVIG